MSASGISIGPDDVPPSDVLDSSLISVSAWFWDLDPIVREGFDEGSREYAISYHLADEGIGVGTGIESLLSAFDGTVGQSFSEMLGASQMAFAEALTAGQGEV